MSGIWDRTAEFLSDNLSTVATIAALTMFLPTAVQEVFAPLQPSAGAGTKLGLGLLTLAVSLLGLWGQAALIALALDPAAGRSGAFARGGARFLPLVGVSLLILLGVIVLGLPVVALLAAGGVDPTQFSTATSPGLSPGTGLAIALYVIVLLPITIWLVARLVVVSAVVVGERRGVGAIRRSWQLTRGLAGRIIGVLVLFGIVVLVAVLAAETVFGSIFRLAFGTAGTINAATVLTALVVALVSTAGSVVACAFIAKLYVALRDRDEAFILQ